MRLIIHPEFFCVKNIWTASAGEDGIFRPDVRLLLICTKRKRELQKNWPSICIGSHVSNISSHRFVPLTISSGSLAPPTIHSNTRYQMIRRTHYKAILSVPRSAQPSSGACRLLWSQITLQAVHPFPFTERVFLDHWLVSHRFWEKHRPPWAIDISGKTRL